jgi:short-subunit dehydrogenase
MLDRLNVKKLIISARRQNELERVKGNCKHSDRIEIFPIDMGCAEKAAEAVKARLSKDVPDIIIQNAGISQRSPGAQTPFENEKAIMEVNFMSIVATSKVLLPAMIARRSGQIVLLNSISGKVGVPFRTSYSASKHALLGYFDALRSEVAEYGVKVTMICPGYIQTAISKNAVSGAVGQSFGKTDSNIAKGYTTKEFGLIALKGIFLEYSELLVPSSPNQWVAVLMRNIWPSAVFYIMRKFIKKKQEEALDQAS